MRMAKYTIYYENGNLEEVEADKLYDSKSLDWIEFFKGSDSASRLVLRVKASKVWKIEVEASA